MSLFGIPEALIPGIGGGAVALIRAWQKGARPTRITISLGGTAVLFGGLLCTLTLNNLIPLPALNIGIALVVIGLISLAVPGLYHQAAESIREENKVEILAEEVRTRPNEPKLAWDLARIKLESYLDRNLTQVSGIFFIIVIVMAFGMALIGYGVWKSLANPALIQPSALAALSGILIQFIGATFLLIYRSTMIQAKEYVVVLERINAVGMSINILESIEAQNSSLRDESRSKIAQDLLKMYTKPALNIDRKRQG